MSVDVVIGNGRPTNACKAYQDWFALQPDSEARTKTLAGALLEAVFLHFAIER